MSDLFLHAIYPPVVTLDILESTPVVAGFSLFIALPAYFFAEWLSSRYKLSNGKRFWAFFAGIQLASLVLIFGMTIFYKSWLVAFMACDDAKSCRSNSNFAALSIKEWEQKSLPSVDSGRL